MQARSAASVDAILKATIQVLLRVGKERLTTTLVAQRAGVSVGTLYQYFPNKSALLRAVLERHMEQVASAVETVCREQRGHSLAEMTAALVTRFLAAKMQDIRTSVALYSVSSDIDGLKVVREMGVRVNRAVVSMLHSAKESLTADTEMVASMLQGMMAGVSRRLLESASPEGQYEKLRDELTIAARAYVSSRVRS